MTSPPPTAPDEGVLVVPSGLVLPEASRRRLHRQFAARPPDVVAVVAPTSALPPGSSVTTAAERAGDRPLDATARTTDPEVGGAVLLATTVAHTVGTTTVTIGAGTRHAPENRGIVVDPGAPSFALDTGPRAPSVPDAASRPPFRWRPVVVLLAGVPDASRARVAARLADALIPLDVEPRLALHDTVDGPLLTDPVVAEPATFTTLRPDLVVALDQDAVDLAEQWSVANRATVIVRLDAGAGDRVHLVPWTIGAAKGRLRAIVGDDVEPAVLAALINRLCSGPLPAPPLDLDRPGPAPSTAVRLRSATGDAEPGRTDASDATLEDPLPPGGATPRPPAAGTYRVLGDGASASPLLAGLVDALGRAGHREVDADPVAPGSHLCLVDVADAHRSPPADGHECGGVTVLVVDEQAGRPAPTGAVVAPGTRAVTASATAADALRAGGVRTIVVPALPRRADLDALGGAADRRIRPAAPTIGWCSGTDGDGSEGPGAGALLHALDRLRDEIPDLAVDVVGTAPVADAELATRPWIHRRPDLPAPAELVGWSAAVATTPGTAEGTGGAEVLLLTLATAGVPTVLPTDAAAAAGPLADPALAVTDPGSPDAWSTRLAVLLDEDRRAAPSARARRLAEALAGEAAVQLVVERFVGWAIAEVRP